MRKKRVYQPYLPPEKKFFKNQWAKLTTKERIFEKVKINEKTGCWEWVASKDRGGYGKFYFRGNANFIAHRAAYIIYKEEIPDGLLVCHTCDVRHCINPEHLFLGTSYDNNQDAINKKRRTYTIHPSRTSYLYGCRCNDCRKIQSEYYRNNRLDRIARKAAIA